MFPCLVTSVGQRKILSPYEESNLRPSDCSTTEPQRLFGERGLLKSSNDTCPAYCILHTVRITSIYIQKYHAIDIADPSSMQDAFHLNFVIDLA